MHNEEDTTSKHMSFGLKMSQNVLQMKMDQTVQRCPGILHMHNDPFKLLNLMQVASKNGLVFNSKNVM